MIKQKERRKGNGQETRPSSEESHHIYIYVGEEWKNPRYQIVYLRDLSSKNKDK